MLDFISNCKQTIIKYKKQLLTFALIPVFMFRSSLSGFAATPYPFLQNSQPILFDISGNGKAIAKFRNSSGLNIRTFESPNSIDQFYGFSLTTDFSVSDVKRFYWGNENSFIPFTFIPSLYDYYFIFNVTSNSSPFTFFPNSVQLVQNTCVDGSTDRTFTIIDMDTTVYHFDDKNSLGFTSVSRCPDDIDNTSINEFLFVAPTSGSIPTYTGIYGVILALPKGNYGDSDLQAVVTAIQNQTIQQNNNFNDFMDSGSGFGGTTSGILSGNDELSGFIDDYTEIEQSMYDKFTENQSAVIGNFSGFSWGSLSTAVDWTSDYLNRIYDNSGDFRTMFMYPILAGIALIFIGRQGLTAYVRSRREK